MKKIRSLGIFLLLIPGLGYAEKHVANLYISNQTKTNLTLYATEIACVAPGGQNISTSGSDPINMPCELQGILYYNFIMPYPDDQAVIKSGERVLSGKVSVDNELGTGMASIEYGTVGTGDGCLLAVNLAGASITGISARNTAFRSDFICSYSQSGTDITLNIRPNK